MLKKVLRYLKYFYTLPWSPQGRKMRIEKLMRSTRESRDICAAITYSRDLELGRLLSREEVKDAWRIQELLEQGKITLPADRE